MRGDRLIGQARLARDLAGLLRLGYPVLEAVQKIDAPVFSLDAVVKSLRKGETFSSSLAQARGADQLFLRLVESAEASECLPTGLDHAAESLENLAARKQKISLALLYPALVVTVACALFWLVVSGSAALFQGLFISSGIELPAVTRFLMRLAAWATHPVGWLIFFLPAMMIWYLAFGNGLGPSLRYKIPLYGRWLLREEGVLYLETLGSLEKLGTPLIEACNIAASTLSPPLRDRMSSVSLALARGDQLSSALSSTALLPDLLLWMIRQREAKEDLKLTELAGLLHRESEVSFATGLVLFEPAVFLLISVGIGFAILGIIMPLYQLLNNL